MAHVIFAIQRVVNNTLYIYILPMYGNGLNQLYCSSEVHHKAFGTGAGAGVKTVKSVQLSGEFSPFYNGEFGPCLLNALNTKLI